MPFMSLRRLFLLLLLCLPMPLFAQQHAGTFLLEGDSLYRIVGGRYWRFLPQDIKNGADTTLDDSRWQLVNSDFLKRDKNVRSDFKGIGWLRLHIDVDSEVAAKTLAMRITHYGASEIFLDGKRLHRYGYLTPKDSSEYINPQQKPLSLPTLSEGHHLLALRYANWLYLENEQRFNEDLVGIQLAFWDANHAIAAQHSQHSFLLVAFLLLFGIFITLSLVHFILYMYYRAEKANARFSLFALCVSLLLAFPVIGRISEDAQFILKLGNLELLTIPAIGYSLSLLLNTLFSKRRWHHYIIITTCLSAAVLILFWRNRAAYGVIAVFALAPVEALYILVSAVWRRLPGARIVGGGMLLFLLLLVSIIIILLIAGDFTFNENSNAGQIFFVVLILAILSIPISMSMYLAWRFAHVNRALKTQLVQVESLSAKTREQETEKQRILESRQDELEREVAERTASLRAEKEKSDGLLRNILPEEVAEELKATGRSEARLYNNVSVLFTDFVDFTQFSEGLSPAGLVAEIDKCFQAFDGIIEKHGLEKIKTVGDAYIAVSGLPALNARHAQSVVAAALEIRDYMDTLRESNPATFQIRLGVHSGPVVAGIVGVKKFAYDIWGDTVNTAARMEQHSEAGKVNISIATYELIKAEFRCSYRGELEAKHKGKLGMYFVEGSLAIA